MRKESTGPYTLDSDGGLAVESVQQPPESPGEIQLALITHALAGPDDSLPTWTDAVRTFDLVDAVQRSIRRRRTIDLHFESMSERSQFKTQMTALGCGVLSLTTVGMVLLLLVGAIFDPRDVEQQRPRAPGSFSTWTTSKPDRPNSAHGARSTSARSWRKPGSRQRRSLSNAHRMPPTPTFPSNVPSGSEQNWPRLAWNRPKNGSSSANWTEACFSQ